MMYTMKCHRMMSLILLMLAALAVGRLPGAAQILTYPSSAPLDPRNHIVSSSPAVGGPFAGRNINDLVGASRFYNAGYTGSRATITNVEAGHIWNRHETLTHVSTFLHSPLPIFAGTQLGEFDRHATWVGQTIGGRVTPGGGEYQRGIAFGADLWSGAIATEWKGVPYRLGFDWSNDNAFVYPYLTAMQTGIRGKTTDVVNSSWGFTSPAGADVRTIALDGLARTNRKTVVLAAGNEGAKGTNTVGGPASGYNSITVAALGKDTGIPYNKVSDFSSRGPSDFFHPSLGLIPMVRASVDIAAPGQNLTLAFYGGTTGGNAGGVDPTGGANNLYSPDVEGTSFASPIVAGGAGLVVDAGYDRFGGGEAIDGRVVKSVLQNSAQKLPGWNNGQTLFGGVLTTSQALDYNMGTGRLNLDAAFEQYTMGTTNVPGLGGGVVEEVGWDFGLVAEGRPTDYFIDDPLRGGSTFTATLNWFVNRTFNSVAADGTMNVSDLDFANLDLELWRVVGGLPTSLVAQSISFFNNTEHFSFRLPSTDLYMLRVVWAGELYDTAGRANEELYGLAWRGTAVPEPGALAMLAAVALPGALFGLRRRARRAK